MSHIDPAGSDLSKELPAQRAKHGKHYQPETVPSHIVDVVEGKNYKFSVLAFWTAILMIISASVHGIMAVFNQLCPDASKGSCARVPMGSSFEVLAIIALMVTVVLAVVSMLLAVEAIAREEYQVMAYVSLSLIAFAILFFVSGAYSLIIEKIVMRFII